MQARYRHPSSPDETMGAPGAFTRRSSPPKPQVIVFSARIGEGHCSQHPDVHAEPRQQTLERRESPGPFNPRPALCDVLNRDRPLDSFPVGHGSTLTQSGPDLRLSTTQLSHQQSSTLQGPPSISSSHPLHQQWNATPRRSSPLIITSRGPTIDERRSNNGLEAGYT